ncbi:MAG: threonine ammonia-lyase [Clostridiales bacterium]|nr:threonine ammonia-lyase [Clostridiales bacterium]
MLNIEKIEKAAEVLQEVIRPTFLIRSHKINPESKLYIKPENLQVTGSFKVRGAYYKISQLSDEEKSRGVIACSAGNHAQGVALGASKNGIKSLICLPDSAPISKVEATKGYGADVCLVPGAYDDAYQRALELKEKHGYTFVHPFNDEDVIAGQGTIGLEIMKELPDADVVLVPVGGGGLISGVAFAVKSINPNCKVYGVQAEGAPSMAKSVHDGKIETLDRVVTFADGIAVKTPGTLTYEMCKNYVDDIVTVTDDEVAAAVLALIDYQRLVAEGAGAVSVAAAMFNKVDVKGKKVVCIVSGGNIDVTILSRVINRGLIKTGRSTDITLELADKPGQLTDVSKIISEKGANVVSIYHDRTELDTEINGCYLRLRLETRNYEHVEEIKYALAKAGYKIVE